MNLTIPAGPLKLWLDDRRPKPAEYNLVVTTSAEAIEMLRTNRVVEISLDHDLGPSGAGTGYIVASWIERAAALGKLPRLRWHVHSQNVVGAQAIRDALESADRFWARQAARQEEEA
jgi:hypothetical protein